MLDADRRSAVNQVVDSLPLANRQRALAAETIDSMSPEEADEIAALFRSIVDGLPAARSAIDSILAASTQAPSALPDSAGNVPAQPAGSHPAHPLPSAPLQAGRVLIGKGAKSVYRDFIRRMKPPPSKQAHDVADNLAVRRGQGGRRLSVKVVDRNAVRAVQAAKLMLEQNAVAVTDVLESRTDGKGRQRSLVQYRGQLKGHVVDLYIRKEELLPGKRRSQKAQIRNSVVALVMDGNVAFTAPNDATIVKRIKAANLKSRKDTLSTLLEVVG